MKRIPLLSVIGCAFSLCCTSSLFAQYGLESLPAGFPTDDITYMGDNQFISPSFGVFVVDRSIKNRVIHGVLGPMVWDWDETSETVILHTEWYGDLYTHLPTVAEENKVLGFTWPYLQSEITGAVYYVNALADISDLSTTPFYNHREIDGEPIGWQRSIGVDLDNASNYYLAAETITEQMQWVLQEMILLQDEYVTLNSTEPRDESLLNEKYDELESTFFTLHELYRKFVFYHARCSLAPIWADRWGADESEISAAYELVDQLPELEELVERVYKNGQEILYVNIANLRS